MRYPVKAGIIILSRDYLGAADAITPGNNNRPADSAEDPKKKEFIYEITCGNT